MSTKSIESISRMIEEALDDGDLGKAGYYANMLLENDREVESTAV